jgi:hypothetical protein
MRVSILDKTWHLYVGQSWVGSLMPTGSDDNWYYADFTEGDAWGNFRPWFVKAVEAQQAGDEGAWQATYEQLSFMGMALVADDGERYDSPTVFINGGSAWFVV